jgi:hypothetical protein
VDVPIKTISLIATAENPQVVLRKDWYGYVVVATELRKQSMTVVTPDTVVVPMRPPTGPVTQAQEVEVLRAAYKKASDVYVIYCETPAGVRTQGMIAVPRAVLPSVSIATG